MALNKNDLVQLVKVAMTANASAPTLMLSFPDMRSGSREAEAVRSPSIVKIEFSDRLLIYSR